MKIWYPTIVLSSFVNLLIRLLESMIDSHFCMPIDGCEELDALCVFKRKFVCSNEDC